MLKIELLLRHSNSALAVQRRSEEEANALYGRILAAMNADRMQTLTLTCDRNPKTILAVLSSEMVAVNLTET